MIYGSVCSGIEAASCAWNPLGWKAAFLSEIEPFPRAVLAHHYPETPLHGDFTTIKANDYAAIDLLVGGTPCQSFSVAGLRKGLDDPRGNLMLEFGALAQRLAPRWIVWENVPGVLSSNGGRDFGTFLGMLAELGYGFAYRVLDAQYFGVAQRRRRVFVVGYFGDWRRAAAVLFEQDCMRWNPPPSREAGKDVAGTISARTQGGGGLGSDFEMAGGTVPTLARCVTTGEGKRQDYETCTIIAHSLRGEGLDASEDGTGRGTPLVPVAYAIQAGAIKENPGHGPDGVGVRSDNCAYTLEARAEVQAVAFAESSRDELRLEGGDGSRTGALSAGGGKPWQGQPTHSSMQVRRLTPEECEFLQGFPRGYTNIPLRNAKGKLNGKLSKDGPRYKALGNSMAVPVIAWLGRRIEFVDSIPAAVKVAA